jgi:hypothetical protein
MLLVLPGNIYLDIYFLKHLVPWTLITTTLSGGNLKWSKSSISPFKKKIENDTWKF